MKNNSITRSFCLCAAALGLSLSISQAANVNKLDTTSMTNNALNWSAVPATTDVGEFAATPSATTLANMTLGGTMTLGGLQLDGNMNGPLVIGSATSTYLTNGASGIDMSAANQNLTFNNLLALGTNQTWLVASAQTLTVNGINSGSGGLIIGDGTPGNSGTVVFGSQANVFTGGLTNNGGNVKLGAAASAGTGTITLGGGTLIMGAYTFANAVNVTGTATITNNSGGSLVASGNFTGAGTLNLMEGGGGTITWSASGGLSAFTGTIKVSDSDPYSFIRFSGATGSTAATFDLGNGLTVMHNRGGQAMNFGALKGGAGTTLEGARSANASSQVAIGFNGASTTFYGTISNGINSGASQLVSLAKYGTGTLTLAGPNAYTGPTTNNAGVLNAGIAEGNNSYGNYGPFGRPSTVANSFVFAGGTLQYSAANNYDYSPRFQMAGNPAISVDVNGQTVSYATALANGTGGLTLADTAGGGKLTLSATPTYTGATTIKGGTLALTSGALVSGSALTIAAGGAFDVSALASPYTLGAGLTARGTGTTASTAATIVPASGGVFDLNTQPVSLTWGGGSSGTDSTHPALTVSQGTLNFNGNTINIVVPGTPLGVGVYTLISAAAITGTPPAAAPSYLGGSGLGFAENGTISVSGNTVILTVTQNPMQTWTDGASDQNWFTAGNWNPATVPHNPGDLANLGTAANSVVTLNQNASLGGILLTNANSYTISGANTLTLDNNGSGAEIEVSGGTANAISTAINLNDSSTFAVSANNSLNVSGVIANAPSVTKALTISGAGTNILGNANTYGPASGATGTTLSGGILRVGNSTSLGAGDLSVAGGSGTLQSGAAGLTLANNIGVASGLTLTANNNGNTFTLGGVISGNGGLAAAGSGTLLLTGVETYTGPTAINVGRLLIGGAGQLGSGAYAGNIADAGFLDYNSSADQTLSGIISGGGAITNDGAGNLTLSGASTYTGVTTINAGTVSLTNAAAAGTGSINLNGGTLALTATGSPTYPNGINVAGTATLSLPNPVQINPEINGAWTGGGTLNVTIASGLSDTLGIGTAGMANFTGTIKVADGTTGSYIRFFPNAGVSPGTNGSSQATFDLGDAGSTTVLFDRVGNPNDLIGALVGGSGTGLQGAHSTTAMPTTFFIGGKNISTTFYGVIADGSQPLPGGMAGIVKVGTGTLYLGGVNTYSGSTTVSSGVLALVPAEGGGADASIANSANITINSGTTLDVSALANPMALASGQTLGGNGTLKGNLNASAGTISPGGTGAAGTLTFNNGLNLSGSASLQMEYSATNSGPAFTNDLIAVNGDLTVSGPITISMAWFGAQSNGVYPVITYTGSYGGNAANDFGAIIPGSAATLVATNITSSTPKKIAMIVAPPARPTTNLVWIGDGINNYFDNTSSNWVAGVSTINKFQSVDTVMFDDLSLANSQNTNVTLSGVLYPSVVIVSNSAAPGGTPVYTLTANSPNTIAGAATLLKTNSGTLVLPSNYNYTGPTILGGGTIYLSTIGNSGVAGPLGASSNDPTNLVFNGGNLYFAANGYTTDRGATMSTNGGSFDIINGGALTFSGVFTGPGSLTMSNSDHGNGQLILSSANTYTNGTVASSGTLVLGNTAAAGTGPITFNGGTVNISSGGTVLNNLNATTNQGGLLTGSQTYQINGTITIPTNGVLNINVIGGGLAGSTNTMTFNSNFVASAGSVIRVKDNTYGFMRMLATSGTTNATIDLGNSYVMLHTKTPANIIDIGGLMGQQGTSVGGSRSAAGATTWRIGANGSNTVFSGTISNNLDGSNGTLGNPTVVNIIKVGTGMLSLVSPNYYTGTTTISNGVLQISNNGTVDFQSLYAGIYPQTYTNGVIDSLLTNDQVFISGGTLAGNGTIWAPIINQYGGNLQPGYSVSAPGTVLTVSNLTMLDGSTTTVKVQRSGPTADQMNVNGVLTYGGVLTVTKADSGYATSDPAIPVFTFGGSGAWDGSSTFATIQPPPGAGLGWSLNQSAGTLSVVTATAPTAGFTGSPLNPLVGNAVTFVNSSANANYWVWNFGDGTTLITGSNTNVPHAYANAGTYTVVQSAFSPGGSNGLTRTSYITVTQPTPVVVFSGGPTNIFVGGAVTLTDGSTDYGVTPVTNVWNFGDTHLTTNVTADISVTHVYTNAGTYTVNLSVSDLSGNSSSNAPSYVTVHPLAQLGAVSATGGNIVFSGAASGMTGQYRVWMTTDISQPLSSWTLVKTGTFGAGGSYGYTAPTGAGPAYYVMSVP